METNNDNNNINEQSKQLIVREFERTLEQKKEVETKAGQYMVVVTLILTMLTQFLIEIQKLNVDKYFSMSFVFLYVPVFILGVVLLIVFVCMLKPRHIKYFKIQELIDLNKDDKKEDIKKTEELLNDCKKFDEVNRKAVRTLDVFNSIVSVCVTILVISFALAFIIFIISIIVSFGGSVWAIK